MPGSKPKTFAPGASVANFDTTFHFSFNRVAVFAALDAEDSAVLVLIGEDLRIVWANHAVLRWLGHDPQALAGRNALELVHPDDASAVAAMLDYELEYRAGADGTERDDPTLSVEVRLATTDREYRVFDASGTNLLHDDAVRGLLMVARDVSHRHVVDRLLVQLASNTSIDDIARSVLDSIGSVVRAPMAEAVVMRDHTGLVRVIQRRASPCQLDGELIEGPWLRSLHDRVEAIEPIDASNSDGPWVLTLPVLDGSGDEAIGVLIVWSEGDGGPTPLERIGLGQYVQLLQIGMQRSRDDAQLRRAAAHDPLTGALNRAEFLAAMRRAAADPGAPPWAVVFLDLDDFKIINDTHGHRLGDRVLVEVVRRLAEVVRPDDFVGRIGGDELALLCSAVTSAAQAVSIAHRALSAIAAQIDLDGVALRVGVSAGIALGSPGADAETVLEQADRGLYHAKQAGKGLLGWADGRLALG